MEARGKQEAWMRRKPEVLGALREQAMIQSAESSNRIEGVTVEPGRLKAVVLGGSRPRDRSEEELAGYRRALEWIFERKGVGPITPRAIQKMHELAQGGHSSDAGKWKERDNEIVEVLADGRSRVRFRPTAAAEVRGSMERLCGRYRILVDERPIPPLLTIATFVFDFLCVHPFRDGNGRVSRLVTTFLLKEQGFDVVRYVSLERLVEERKDEYYRVLESCSQGWHEGRNEIAPWWHFFLAVLREAYGELERQADLSGVRPVKSELVRRMVLDQPGRFTLGDLAGEFPAASPQLIKRVLGDLKREGRVRLSGRGRGAVWEVSG